ncbi:hypothetical protein CDAR_2771 [Caerostris darwini]|uniref:Uncharacterized protein n=1 Tax=Caerostris darwini TaxID=1538125 RepID=A0AAV4SUY7_9ARAC|nr:hypothetical protein CDAR_2731 [Caerostris darwini]GIY36753.1 hypothetical protein CDAR_2771 [Caerostris darwini]
MNNSLFSNYAAVPGPGIQLSPSGIAAAAMNKGSAGVFLSKSRSQTVVQKVFSIPQQIQYQDITPGFVPEPKMTNLLAASNEGELPISSTAHRTPNRLHSNMDDISARDTKWRNFGEAHLGHPSHLQAAKRFRPSNFEFPNFHRHLIEQLIPAMTPTGHLLKLHPADDGKDID